jgi:phage-related protein
MSEIMKEMTKNKAKSIVWMGSSLEDLKKFPRDVQRDVGFALYRAQIGKHHHSVKPLKGLSGVMEIVSFYATDA